MSKQTEKEIEKLARFILANGLMPKGFEGSAVDCAIEIMKQGMKKK